MTEHMTSFLKNLARGIASQFGEHCEVVVHELDGGDPERTIIAVENGHISGRTVGGGPSKAVLHARSTPPEALTDHLDYLTRTEDGRVLRSSTIYVRDEDGRPVGVFSINYDTTALVMAENLLHSLAAPAGSTSEPERIVQNVGELLDELIRQSVALTGKPVAAMSKEDKIRAIRFLNENGAFLITKASEKISEFFGISKYPLYNYFGQSAQCSG